MRFNNGALLFFFLSKSSIDTSYGFVIPSRKSVIATSLLSRPEVYEINRKLDELADQCGDVEKPVVTIASEVEDIYNASKDKDVVSFNVLLKAWGRACQSLQRQKQKHIKYNIQESSNSVPSIAVYTPRDAAEHLTKHLMEAEASYEKDPDGGLIAPDETSYNIAIGKQCSLSIAVS